MKTEKTFSSQENVTTFSQKKRTNKENEIRHMVRFSSLLVLGLLIVEYIRFNYPDIEFITVLDIVKPILMLFLIPGAFLIGLILVFFQLRWINESRNKSTNLGGLLGLFGLFSTLIMSIIALFIPQIPFIILIGLGLALTVIGLFAEMTRIDEPVVFWLSVYKFLVVRLFLFIIAFSIMGLGIIWWDDAIGLPLALFIGGYVFGVVVWLNHTHFRKITTTLSTLVLLWGLFLLYPYIILGELWPIPLPLLLSGVLIIIGLSENGIIWRKEIFYFLVAVKNAIVQAIRATFRFIRETLRSFYLAIVAFFHYIWDHRVDILRGFLTIIGSLVILFSFLVFLNSWSLDDFVWGIIFGVPILYVAWFNQTNLFIKQTLISIKDAIVRTTYAIYNFLVALKNAFVQAVRTSYQATVSFFHYTWDHRVDIVRAFLTIIGFLLIILAFFLSPLVSPQYQIDLGQNIAVIILGFLFLYAAWFHQTNHFIKQSLIAIGNVSVQTYRRFVVFLKNTYHSTVQFLQKYYRDVITTFALGLMTISPLVSWILKLPPILPLIPFLLGYIVGVAIWYKHANFKAVTTTFNTAVFLCGFVLLLTVLSSTDVQTIWISSGLVLIGVVADGIVWRVELWQFLTHTIEVAVTTIKKAAHAIFQFLVDTKNAIVLVTRSTYLATMAFLHSTWDHRVDILRALSTIIGAFVVLFGVVVFFSSMIVVSGYTIVISPQFTDLGGLVGIIIGGLFLYAAWFRQTNLFVKRSLIAFRNVLVTIKNTIVQAVRSAYLATVAFLHYTWNHRVDILRAFLTITGGVFVYIGLSISLNSWFTDLFGIGEMILGGIFVYVAQFHQTNNFIKRTLIAIRDAIVRTCHAIYNFLVDVKNAIVHTVRSAYLATVAFLYYIWDHNVDILRALASLTGPLMILRAFFPDLGLTQPLISLVLLVCGLGLLYAAWFSQVNHYIKQSLIAIRNALAQAALIVVQFLSQALAQLGQLVVAMIDSIILILCILLSVSAIFYGFVLILSGIIDPSGEWTRIFLAESLPILGEFIELIAKFVQNFTLFNLQQILESDVETLLGEWAGEERIILIILGVSFITPGVILGIITFLMRDSIKLSSLKKRIWRSDNQ
ncbi:MAG: hypothetical protein ACFFC6_03110 [Promethearchaeota archaeon]